MIRRGFTLVEMLLAVTLAAMLMAAVVLITAQTARDQRRLPPDRSASDRVRQLLRRDLANARTIRQIPGGFELEGNGGIDPATLAPSGRLTRVFYRIARDGMLRREQAYLDDAVQPRRWREIVCSAAYLSITPVDAQTQPIAATMQIRIDFGREVPPLIEEVRLW